jgi:CRISPR/Cas system-associated endonuclease Cas3-HD
LEGCKKKNNKGNEFFFLVLHENQRFYKEKKDRDKKCQIMSDVPNSNIKKKKEIEKNKMCKFYEIASWHQQATTSDKHMKADELLLLLLVVVHSYILFMSFSSTKGGRL